MRLFFVYFILITMLAANVGCQSFQNRLGQTKSTLFGLKRNKQAEDLSEELLDPLGARNTNRILLDDLSPSQIATTLKIRTTNGVDQTKAEASFQKGNQAFAQGSSSKQANSGEYQSTFIEAANHYRAAGAYLPDSQLEEEALFKEGESYFFADRYVQSNRAFEKLIANYSGTRYLDLAEMRRFTIALYWLEMSENYDGPSLNDPKRPKTGLAAEARRILHRIRLDDPTGKLADEATLAFGQALLKANQTYEAADAFEDLRMNYPGSKHQFTAHMLELQARLQSYQGKSYDDTPLIKADKLMKAIVRQFPQQAKEQLPYLEKQAGLIRTQLAERDYSMGQYFENRGENRSAVIYYQEVAKKYQDTQFGESLSEQIADVSKRPAKPKQHGEWLINMFPETEQAKPMIASGDNESIFR